MELLLGAIALITTKKVPAELNLGKIDTLHNKVKILPPAAGEQKP